MDSLTEKQWILLTHLGTFIGYIFPFGNVIVPLIVYSLKKDAALVRLHSRNSLNFQISITLYILISLIFVFVLIGIGLIVLLVILQFILVIMATIKADKDEIFHYPMTINFIKE